MEESRDITQKSASNLALAFVMLPKPKRDAMSVLYAFCRVVDDVADEDSVPLEERRRRLGEWRRDLDRVFGTETPVFGVNRELKRILPMYPLPRVHFEELLTGVESDLAPRVYETWDELETYCYRVASVVGLLSIEIFGYSNPATRDYAIALGKALQLTNILRDVRGDAERGRIYLPRECLSGQGVQPREIFEFQYSDRFLKLASAVAARATDFYRLARETLPNEDRSRMVAAELMGTVYWRLLRKLERGRFQVFGPRPTRLNNWHKLALILQCWGRHLVGQPASIYGVS